jgi:hypothetical protein
MAFKITRKPSDYVSETAYAYDVAQTSQYFDKSVYEGLAASGDQEFVKKYLYGIAGAKDKTASAFDQREYSYLTSPEDKAAYTIYKLSGEKDLETDSYFDFKIQEAVDKQTYESLSGFEKTMNSIGGIIGNALNETVLGTVEGLVDLGAVVVGQKDWAAKDFTGVGANREALQKYSRAYTYLDKNKVWGIANDVVTGLSQMGVMFIPYVGQVAYFGAMAGNTAAEAVRVNPDINYLALMGYTTAVTGVEFATEKLSAKILGGPGNFIDQKIFGTATGKGLTKLGQKAAGSWVSRVGLNFLSEGLEESIAEFADTALFNVFIAQGDNALRKDYSMQDILYAGLIGGLIGGLMEGGRIATTSKVSITKDGDVVSTKTAKKLGIETKLDLTKIQSLTFAEQLAQAKAMLQTDAVADLKNKYSDLSLKQIQESHPDEYQKAVVKNEKISDRMTEITLGLNRVYELAGEEGFKKASDLANSVFETQQRLLSNYVAKATGVSSQNRGVENDFKFKNPDSSIKITDSLTAEQIRLKRNFKNKFGIDLFYGDIGTKDGENKKFGLTLDEKTIVIDEVQMGQMSEQEILDKVIKEELVHALQFTQGIITPKTLFEINKAMGNIDVLPKELDPAYASETGLTKLAEAQAKAVAEVLLFDKLTVSKMFYSQYSTLNKVYKFFKNLKTKFEDSKQLRSQKGKLKYNKLLKAMKMYRDIAAERLGTAENVEQFVKDYQLTALEQQQLMDKYLENPNILPIDEFAEQAYLSEQQDLFVHYGDLSGTTARAEKVSSWTSTRNTGAFGTGLYAFSLKAADDDIVYRNDNKRTRYEIDISNYDLFKVKNADEGFALHKLANDLNNYVLFNQGDVQNISDRAIDLLGIAPEAVSQMISDLQDLDYNISREIGPDEFIPAKQDGEYQTPFTLLMISLGFDGIDVRGISELDNAAYGSVIFELKESDRQKALKKQSPIEGSVGTVYSKEKQTIKLNKADGTGQIELDLDVAKEQIKEKPFRRTRVKKWSEGVQLTVFDSIEPNMSVKEREATRQRASEQEIPLKNLKITHSTIEKANTIKELCSTLAESEYQGDIENHKFATITNEIFEKGADLFGEITPDEWQTIRAILFVDSTDPRASAALNAVTRYAYLHRANQFKSIDDFVKTVYANSASSAGQIIGLTSHDYSSHSVQSFVTELAIKHQVEDIALPAELVLNMRPEFKTIDDMKSSLENEIVDLKNKAKSSKDAYDKWDLNRQAASKERILTALNDNDIALAIDEQMTGILESNENVSENLKRQNDTYRAIIEWLLEHANFENNSLKGFSDKKVPLSKNLEKVVSFFEGLESFRYLMMLSNPATALKNGVSNTLILGQSYIEDFGTKTFENTNLLSGVNQIRYTGEYDKAFSDWVETTYLEKVKSDAEGDKYTSNELRKLQQQYAEAKDPLKKSKILSKVQQLERKLLNDKFWVTKRTMTNLKNTLAGSSDLILSEARHWLVSKYRGKLAANTITDAQLILNISATNKELSDLYRDASSGDKVAIMKLATKLNLDIISPDLKYQQSIYYHSFYRANKLFFKTENWFTRAMSNLNNTHPAMAYVVRHFMPFVRVMANSTSYVINRSPIGLAKGIFKAFQTKAKWSYQMTTAIEQYYRHQYTKIMSQQNADFKFKQEEFNTWLDATVDTKTKQALSGDKAALQEVFKAMAEQGFVNSGLIGSDNLYARADVLEQLAQGATGTAIMTLGLLLGALTDAFEYDDDDEYLGAVIKIGDLKIGLSELSPFSTIFTMSAMLTSDKVDKNVDAAFNIFADATILSTLDSALSYSDGVWDYLKNQSISIIGQYQPAITKAISKLVNNSKKDKSGAWGVKLVKTMAANSLLFNHLVPDKINPYTGEPEKYYDTGWFEGLFDITLPVGVRVDSKTDFEKESERLNTKTTGLSGNFTINGKQFSLTGKTKQKYANYKAKYISNKFNNIVNGVEKVTIKDDKTGKYKTTTYDKLSDAEKSRVLSNLYSTSTTITKIQYWLDQGNTYVCTDKTQYHEYKKLFGNSARIIYKNKWSTSKFVEGK